MCGPSRPSGALPALWRAWLASAMRPAICGLPALVPPSMCQPVRITFGYCDSKIRTPPLTAAFHDRSGMERAPWLTDAWPDCHDGAAKKLLTPPPVTQLPPPKMKHSFQSASRLVADEVKAIGLVAVGASVQPRNSWVPPTAVTSGLTAGKPTAVVEKTVDSLCCLDVLPLPSSPDEARNVSPLAMPLAYVWLNDCICCRAAPPNVCSPRPKLCEKTVPGGSVSMAICMALNRLGRPCTPNVSAGGVDSRAMCASGAIA